MVVYLDCAATTPMDPRVFAAMQPFETECWGNPGSRHHEFGQEARRATELARSRIAEVVGARRGDVVFTSGATESNNLAIFGLAGARVGGHFITTRIEHRAVLEPMQELSRRGHDVDFVAPAEDGCVPVDQVLALLRDETRLVSIMHANNETGVLQPIEELADALKNHTAYLHVDAAQSFGKANGALSHPRIDLLSVSAHKLFGPKGIGALITRRRGRQHPPLKPLCFGGGQERGLRPGTLPAALVVGFGEAARLATVEGNTRQHRCREYRHRLLRALKPLQPRIHGATDRALAHILNLSFPAVDTDGVIEAWSPYVAISDGSACSSMAASCSHVLSAMALPAEVAAGAVRLSWYHDSQFPDTEGMVESLKPLVTSRPGA